MTDLHTFLGSMYPLSADLADRLHSITIERSFNPKFPLVRAGQLSQHLYFVRQGLLRRSYTKGEKEISSGFIREGELCFPIELIFHHPYGMETIQTLEDTRAQIIPYQQWLAVYRDFPAFRTIGLRLMEKYIQADYLHFRGMWMQPAKERYRWLHDNLPQLATRAQAKHLASLLGMTNVMYSKLGARQ
ncbi:MAG TPA: Crp/Fnr family transcriptional regulator [Puia sp.]|nr:Crp/Fnr family transcriptional regulator [Puia sp.]